jgi:hypothetical protein
MRSRNNWTGMVVGVVMGVLFSAAVVLAGGLEPGGGPTAAGSQMYTLEQIYDRLDAGAAGSKRASFTEPSSGPAGTGHTLDEIMGKLPALDDANGAGPANVAQGKTYWGLTSGQWGLKTGTMLTPGDTDLVAENIKQGVNIFGVVGAYPLAGVARTGQTPTVPFVAPNGSDGNLQKGVAWPNPRFTDNNNGTVTDNLTGLIWLKNANFFGVRNWETALTDCNTLAANGMTLTDGSVAGDWRLPNVKELQSLIDFAYANPALSNAAGTGQWLAGNPFDNVQSIYYWSSTAYAGSTNHAWIVYLDYGVANNADKINNLYVWPVRGGQ